MLIFVGIYVVTKCVEVHVQSTISRDTVVLLARICFTNFAGKMASLGFRYYLLMFFFGGLPLNAFISFLLYTVCLFVFLHVLFVFVF